MYKWNGIASLEITPHIWSAFLMRVPRLFNRGQTVFSIAYSGITG